MTVQPQSPNRSLVTIVVVAAIALVGVFLLLPRDGQPGATSSPAASASAEPSESASPEASASPSEEASPSGSAAGEVGALEIEARDFAFEAPAETGAGPTRVIVNNTGQEEHQAQIVRLNEGKTFEDLTAALQGPDPTAAFALFTFSGGPTGVVPGASVATTVDLQPGTHAFLCFIESPDGIPHVAKGMVGQLEVTGTAAACTLPAGDAEVTLQDFAYVGLTTLTPGEHTVAVTNDGPQPHEATLVKLNDGDDRRAGRPVPRRASRRAAHRRGRAPAASPGSRPVRRPRWRSTSKRASTPSSAACRIPRAANRTLRSGWSAASPSSDPRRLRS